MESTVKLSAPVQPKEPMMQLSSLKKSLFVILVSPQVKDKASRSFNAVMLAMIFLNVLAVMFETEQHLYDRFKPLFDGFEIFSIAVFTVEYGVRLWTCTELEEFASPFWGRLRFATKPMQLIDLLAILPFYIPFLALDLRMVRVVRLFRIFRLFKMGRYAQSITTLVNVIRGKKEELLITLFSGFILLVIASSLIFLVEHEAQPESFSSIPASMWWGVVTLTTVGYGDVYPKTLLGKILASFIALLGIGLFAMPAGIIASGFASEIHKEPSGPRICPHCGKEIH